MKNKTYIAIDLKSFYASVECAERGLAPLTTNLVVADVSRTDKTICLAVTPSLKSHGKVIPVDEITNIDGGYLKPEAWKNNDTFSLTQRVGQGKPARLFLLSEIRE